MTLAVDIRRSLVSAGRVFTLDVSFSTAAPLAVVFGHSGSGKSVTMQAIAGLLRPDEGSILLNDRALFDSVRRINVPARERRVGYVFQDYALFPHLTVSQNVAFGLPPRGRSLPTLLESFALAELANSYPAQLSGGQRQRVALARALAPQPELLLLDEPFAALDPLLRERMRAELLRTVTAAHIPVVLITHDPADADFFPGQLFMFADGRVVESDGPAREQLHPGAGLP
ncbi:MAG: ATP-binding cassette domain-containing protein [Gammaproteobacteria bacterium]